MGLVNVTRSSMNDRVTCPFRLLLVNLATKSYTKTLTYSGIRRVQASPQKFKIKDKIGNLCGHRIKEDNWRNVLKRKKEKKKYTTNYANLRLEALWIHRSFIAVL